MQCQITDYGALFLPKRIHSLPHTWSRAISCKPESNHPFRKYLCHGNEIRMTTVICGVQNDTNWRHDINLNLTKHTRNESETVEVVYYRIRHCTLYFTVETCSVTRDHPILYRSLNWMQYLDQWQLSNISVDLKKRVDQLSNTSLSEFPTYEEKGMDINPAIVVTIWIRSSYDPSIQSRLIPIV